MRQVVHVLDNFSVTLQNHVMSFVKKLDSVRDTTPLNDISGPLSTVTTEKTLNMWAGIGHDSCLEALALSGPPLLDTPRSGQPPQNGQTACPQS